jgi:hypothetical protein
MASVPLLLLTIVVSLFLALLGGCLLVGVVRFGRAASVQATATVVSHEVAAGDEGETFYYPVVRFQVEAETWEIKTATGHTHSPYRDGQTVTVYYPLGRPDEAQLHRYEAATFAFLALVVGTLFACGATWELWKSLTR